MEEAVIQISTVPNWDQGCESGAYPMCWLRIQASKLSAMLKWDIFILFQIVISLLDLRSYPSLLVLVHISLRTF